MSLSKNNGRPSLEQRFSKNMNGLLKIISSIVGDLSDEGLIEFGKGALDIIIVFVSNYDPNNLMWCLATTHENWGMINEKDENFILETFPKAIKDFEIPIDPRCLTCPIRCLKEIKKDRKWSNIDEDEWPVGDEDIESIWKYIKSLVIMVCKKIHRDRKRVSISDIDEEDSEEDECKKVYDKIDIGKWGKVFNIDYDNI